MKKEIAVDTYLWSQTNKVDKCTYAFDMHYYENHKYKSIFTSINKYKWK